MPAKILLDTKLNYMVSESEYLKYVRNNTIPEITNFLSLYKSIMYIRDFLIISYKTFPRHTNKTRNFIKDVAKQLSKSITVIMNETETFTGIEVEIFLGLVKILLTDLEEKCIIYKNEISYGSINNGGIDIAISAESYSLLQLLSGIDIVDQFRTKKEINFEHNINDMIISILSGIQFTER